MPDPDEKLRNRTEKIKKISFKANLEFVSFVGPMVLGLIVFAYFPIIWGFFISLSEARGAISTRNFVGIRNYISILQNTTFIDSLMTVLIYGVIVIPSMLFLSLTIAIMIKRLNRGRGFFRSVFFLPQAVSMVVASLIWKQAIFNGMNFGIANTILGVFNISPIQWTQDILFVWAPILTVRIWLGLGLYMILYVASLEEIPQELYDAASLDGVERGFRLFRYITFPLLRNTNIIILFLLMVNVFRAFDEFYMLAGSGEAILSVPLIETPMVFLYVACFGGQNYGLGTAGSFIVALFVIFVTSLQFKLVGLGKAVGN